MYTNFIDKVISLKTTVCEQMFFFCRSLVGCSNSMESLQSSCLLTTSKAKQPFIANPCIAFLLRGGFVKWDKPSNYFLQEAQKEISKMAFGLIQTTVLELHARSSICP